MATYYSVLVLCLLALGPNTVAGDYADLAQYLSQQANNATFMKMFQQHVQLFTDQPKTAAREAPFSCKSFVNPRGPAVSVHELSPSDIKVVGAIGDSITAGTGISAGNVLGLLWENRQLSWSIGGEGDILQHRTLPNILKVYSPKVTGYSTSGGPVWLAGSRFNVADPGAKSSEMLGQAQMLVSRMKEDTSVDFDNDWKVITLFVGDNDLCDFCEDKQTFSPENYVNNIQLALDYLHDNLKRAFVNVVEVLDIAVARDLRSGLICDTLHQLTCACASYPANSEEEAELLKATTDYQSLVKQLAESGRYDDKEDFTVVAQPFFEQTKTPKINGTSDPDLSYFAPDCFHLSQKGHEAATDALWNNMIEPVGSKRLKWTPGEPVECPSEEKPFFYTYKNSGPNKGVSVGAHQPLQQSGGHSNPDNTTPPTTFPVLAVAIGTISITVLVAVIGFVVHRRFKRHRQYSSIPDSNTAEVESR